MFNKLVKSGWYMLLALAKYLWTINFKTSFKLGFSNNYNIRILQLLLKYLLISHNLLCQLRWETT